MPNLLDFYVTQILSVPYEKYDAWHVRVMANAYGRESENTLTFKTRKEALDVHVGYEFQEMA